MKFISTILDSIKSLSQNTAIWIKAIVLILVLGGVFTVGAIYFSKTKVVKEDCSFLKSQNTELIQALIHVKDGLKELTVSYMMDEQPTQVMYASFDTIPKKKKLTQTQVKATGLMKSIDSILIKVSNAKQ